MPKKNLKVLVVDDDVEIAKIIAERFQIYGFNSETASGGIEALQMAENTPYDVILTDLNMKNGPGLELIKNINKKTTAPSKNAKIYAMTGGFQVGVDQVLGLGAEGLVYKPVTANKIMDIVRRATLTADRYWQAEVAGQPVHLIHRNFATVDEALDKSISFGKGGFMLSEAIENAKENDFVHFKISFDSKAELNGSGYVRWVRRAGKGVAGATGIEIAYLQPSSRSFFVDWIRLNEPNCFIPAA
jgi:CheY-like chemotaxis protein